MNDNGNVKISNQIDQRKYFLFNFENSKVSLLNFNILKEFKRENIYHHENSKNFHDYEDKEEDRIYIHNIFNLEFSKPLIRTNQLIFNIKLQLEEEMYINSNLKAIKIIIDITITLKTYMKL